MGQSMRILVAVWVIFLLTQCSSDKKSGIDPNDQNNTTDIPSDVASAYPVGLAISSPLQVASTQAPALPQQLQNASPVAAARSFLSGDWLSSHEMATTEINEVLNGQVSVFDGNDFFVNAGRANCYGPTVKYSSHPDEMGGGGGSADGQLPGGDVGIWLESESSGEACAAAELNSLLSGLSSQGLAALKALAALAYVAFNENGALPAAGDSADLTAAMNAAGLSDTTFIHANLGQPETDTWSYELEFDLTRNSDTHRVYVNLEHHALGTDNYDGKVFYRIGGSSSDFPGGNCAASSRTLNGSLWYELASANDLKVQSRTATYCGENIDGRVVDSSTGDYGQLDPNKRIPDDSEGWSENFNLFVGNFDPSNSSGTYTFAWQAGAGDSNTRVFQIGINDFEAPDGEAYFAYGAPMHQFTGEILGMICNWAGPGSNHSLQDYAQRQFVEFDAAAGIFVQPEGGSDILYAPTNSCSYDGNGNFLYDTNADGSLDDETHAAVTADLFTPGSGQSITEAIAARGYDLPQAPGGWPAP
ncbi:MAG: hypothetical protein IPJ88_15570 [Myxococcales bacterium]|nr:MAG: hypothetical protein IPJ88_15570 [Myxococcales bacterium]